MDDDFKNISFANKRKRKMTKAPFVVSKPAINATRCLICQIPLLDNVSVSSHMSTCLGAREDASECPDGLCCKENHLMHFKRFSHYKLALSKSQEETSLIKKIITHPNISTDKINDPEEVSKKSKTDTSKRSISDTELDNKQCICFVKVVYIDDIVTSKKMTIQSGTLDSQCYICLNKNESQTFFKPLINMKLLSEFKVDSFLKENPVEVNIIYNEEGCKKITIEFFTGFELGEFELKLGNCCHSFELKSVIGKGYSFQENVERTPKTLAFFDFSSLSLNNCTSKEFNIVKKLQLIPFTPIDICDFINCDNNVNNVVKNVSIASGSQLQVEPLNLEECGNSVSLDDDLSESRSACTFESQNYVNNLLGGIDWDKDDVKEKWRNIFKKKNPVENSSVDNLFINNGEKSKISKKSCPFYKRIPGTSFSVDAFQYGEIPGVSHYFLTHFHSDHYYGLTRKFKQPIICSSVTASLVLKKLKVDRRYLHIVCQSKPFVIGRIKITPLDANHCPGSLMFLFELPTGCCYLHVGDFRASPEMETYLAFSGINIDTLYLDTTYCNSCYEFPSQEDVVNGVVQIALKQIKLEPATLIVSGTYTIGKEKIFMGIANALKSNIWAPKSKRDVLMCLGDKVLTSKIVEYPFKAQVHVWPMTDLNHQSLEQHLKDCGKVFKHVLAFSPTGWNFKKNCSIEDIPPIRRGNVTIFSVPYSEHSSYNELRKFVKFLKPSKVVPTVASRNQTFKTITQCCTEWLTEPDNNSEKEKPDTQKKLTSFFNANGGNG